MCTVPLFSPLYAFRSCSKSTVKLSLASQSTHEFIFSVQSSMHGQYHQCHLTSLFILNLHHCVYLSKFSLFGVYFHHKFELKLVATLYM